MTTTGTGVKTVSECPEDPIRQNIVCRTSKSAPPPPKITQQARAMHIERACLAGWQQKKKTLEEHRWATKER